MRKTFQNIVGPALIIAGVGGLIFSIFGIVLIWRFRPSITESLVNNLQTTRNVLTTTEDGLELAKTSLDNTLNSLDALESTVQASAATLESTTPMIETLTTLTQVDLPNTLDAAQTSLKSAQQSAGIIDRFLGALSFIPGVNYNPEVPLAESLQLVSESLNGLPAALDTMESSLETSGDNLEIMKSDIELIAADIKSIRNSLSDSRDVLDQYQTLASDMQDSVEKTETNLPEQIKILAWVLTFILIWMAFSQFGLILQGWGLLHPQIYIISED